MRCILGVFWEDDFGSLGKDWVLLVSVQTFCTPLAILRWTWGAMWSRKRPVSVNRVKEKA